MFLKNIRIGNGYDIHRLVLGRDLIIGVLNYIIQEI